MTPEERTVAVQKIMAMRPGSAKPKPSSSVAIDIDRVKDDIALKKLETSDNFELNGVNLTELHSIKYKAESVAGARKGKLAFEAGKTNEHKYGTCI